MKLQNLTVIFVIIIIPIALILSSYIQTQIDTLTLQTSYDTMLSNATYDALKTYQLNSTNSGYSDVSSEKIRYIEASISSFYNSLTSSMGLEGNNEENIKQYIPAVLYTLYDGYYIYTPFKNEETGKIEYGLKPYVYYSCRYVKDNIDVTVNYTLDNYMTVYGTINGEYVTKSGFLINLKNNTYKGIDKNSNSIIEVDDIDPEVLSETVSYLNGSTIRTGEYQYVYVNKVKNYYDKASGKWFIINTYNKRVNVNAPFYITGEEGKDTSARDYIYDAIEFTQWVDEKLGEIKVEDAKSVKATGVAGGVENVTYSHSGDKIFNFIDDSGSYTDNDPDSKSSTFSDHRREVIKKSIETNLNAAIKNYSDRKVYNFKMPKISDTEWDKIISNISITSFMQGVPIGYKYYNGYKIVINNENKEFINLDSIYMVEGKTASNFGTYHRHDCINEYTGDNIKGYLNLDFKKISITDEDEKKSYYYRQNSLACYDCVLGSSGKKEHNPDWFNNKDKDWNRAYYTALFRERYNGYRSNEFNSTTKILYIRTAEVSDSEFKIFKNSSIHQNYNIDYLFKYKAKIKKKEFILATAASAGSYAGLTTTLTQIAEGVNIDKTNKNLEALYKQYDLIIIDNNYGRVDGSLGELLNYTNIFTLGNDTFDVPFMETLTIGSPGPSEYPYRLKIPDILKKLFTGCGSFNGVTLKDTDTGGRRVITNLKEDSNYYWKVLMYEIDNLDATKKYPGIIKITKKNSTNSKYWIHSQHLLEYTALYAINKRVNMFMTIVENQNALDE